MTTLTTRRKFIAAAACPQNEFSRQEIREAKFAATGHYWNEPDYACYCAYSPSGKREYFEYNLYSWGTVDKRIGWIKTAKKAAKFWAQGKYKKARHIMSTIE